MNKRSTIRRLRTEIHSIYFTVTNVPKNDGKSQQNQLTLRFYLRMTSIDGISSDTREGREEKELLQIFKLSHFGHVLLNDSKTPTKEFLRN
jgi:hypothetical protein